jgi:hypothetical protein
MTLLLVNLKASPHDAVNLFLEKQLGHKLFNHQSHQPHKNKNLLRNGGIREANGAEFLKAHPQARLQVGLQKLRQHDLPGTPRFLFTFSCQFVIFVVPSVLRYQTSEIEGCAALSTTYTPQDFSEGSAPVIHSPASSNFQPPSSAIH